MVKCLFIRRFRSKSQTSKTLSCACISPQYALSLSMHFAAIRSSLCRVHVIHLFGSSSFSRTDRNLHPLLPLLTGSWDLGIPIHLLLQASNAEPSLHLLLQASSAEPSLSGADGSPPPPTGQQSSPLEIDVVSRFWGNVGNTPERNA